jgi:uncharacterized pyridoxal phosphate-containing UPF0001 family protein
MALIAVNLQAVRSRIARAAQAAHRHPEDIALVAVSKTFPAGHIAEAYAAGQRAFGENHAQEAVEKITVLAALPLEWRVAQERQENKLMRSDAIIPSAGVASPEGPLLLPLEWRVAQERQENKLMRSDAIIPSAGVASPEGPLLLPLEWHFIGPIQSNKTRLIAECFQWVHSVDREKIAQRLNAARPDGTPPLNVLIQVNVSGEAAKSGVAPGEEAKLADAIARLPRLKLRGLMAIPEPTTDVTLQRRRFALLRELKDRLAARGHALDTLSMGMSDDLEAAIMEGATMVRVGTAIFGQRRKF